MKRNDCGRAGEVDERSGAQWNSLILEPGIAMENARIAELPLKGYLHSRGELRLERMYFPLGYPVKLMCNSHRVLDAADESWSDFQAMFHAEPLEIQMEVRPSAGLNEELPPSPAFMLRGAVLLQMADADNFFISDLKRGRAMGGVTAAAVACPRYLRYFFLEGAALSMISATRAVAVHAACLCVDGKGVLLCGDSGEGKSTLAYAGARSGWTYVSDDATYISMDRGDRLATGNCTQMRFRPSGVALFPELAGRPITPRAAGKPSIEVRTSEWPHISTANLARVDHIVFLNRRYADTPELIPLRTSSVLPWFKQYLISPPEVRPAQEAALDRLLSAGVFELRYSDLGWAIDRINELARKGN
jgi:hypothetical protein